VSLDFANLDTNIRYRVRCDTSRKNQVIRVGKAWYVVVSFVRNL